MRLKTSFFGLVVLLAAAAVAPAQSISMSGVNCSGGTALPISYPNFGGTISLPGTTWITYPVMEAVGQYTPAVGPGWGPGFQVYLEVEWENGGGVTSVYQCNQQNAPAWDTGMTPMNGPWGRPPRRTW